MKASISMGTKDMDLLALSRAGCAAVEARSLERALEPSGSSADALGCDEPRR